MEDQIKENGGIVINGKLNKDLNEEENNGDEKLNTVADTIVTNEDKLEDEKE